MHTHALRAHMQAHTQMHMHASMHAHMNMRAHTCRYICITIYMHMCARTRAHTHTHTYTLTVELRVGIKLIINQYMCIPACVCVLGVCNLRVIFRIKRLPPVALQQAEAQPPQSAGMEEMEKKAAHFKAETTNQLFLTSLPQIIIHACMWGEKMDSCLSIFEAVATTNCSRDVRNGRPEISPCSLGEWRLAS